MIDMLMKMSIVAFMMEAKNNRIALAIMPGIHENAMSMPPMRSEPTIQI